MATTVRLLIASCLACVAMLAAGRPIETRAAPVDSLADGRSGVFAFRSQTPANTEAYVRRAPGAAVTVTAELSLPPHAKGPVAAVVILHGSAGVGPGEWAWAARMNALGYAALVVDSFWGRGLSETATDQERLSMTADIADAYAALRMLATHPAIDPHRVAVMGFSRGGVAALYSTLEPMRRAVIHGDLRFAAHVALYPSCGIRYSASQLDGAPVLMLLGASDDYTPAAPCQDYARRLSAQGSRVMTTVYPHAFHAFDRPFTVRRAENSTSARECHGDHDLDRGVFTMATATGPVTGPSAVSAARSCLRRGVTLGGDAQAMEDVPGDVASFLARTLARP